jgi:hypothetical protein
MAGREFVLGGILQCDSGFLDGALGLCDYT